MRVSRFWCAALVTIVPGAWGQYAAAPAGPPPRELKPAIAALLQRRGFLVTKDGAKYCELWFRTAVPPGAPVNEVNVTLPEIPAGALLGVMRLDAAGSDRRGARIAPGLYLLRYGRMPNDENHEGAAPQRDFLVLTPVAADSDPNANPNFDALVRLSRKVTHTWHPAVLSVWKADADAPGLSDLKDSDWVLETRIGATRMDVIVVGTASH